MSRIKAIALTTLFGAAGFIPSAGANDVNAPTKLTVQSEAECAALCKEAELCRGYQVFTTIINDIPQNDKTCQLSNGLEENSAFSFPTPPPLDLNLALTDLNNYRRANNLTPLTLNAALNRASQIHAQDMTDRGSISHIGSDGSEPSERVEKQNYNYLVVGENVASGQADWPEVFQAWKDSPGHNANLLREGVNEFGAALIFDPTSKYATYWAMLVAAPYPK